MKILMTGNPEKDIAKQVAALYDDINFVCRSSNADYKIDLSKETNQDRLAVISKDYEVFINSSLVPNFGQTQILQKVWTEWRDSNKAGHIINFGSAVDYYYRPDNRLYPVEKRALRDLNRSLTKHCNWFDSKIRCTYFSFGGVSTEKTKEQWGHYKHFDTTEIAEYLKWIIESPIHANIDEMHITPIQPETKKKMKQKEVDAPQKWESGDSRIFLINEE
jgi:NAD(P)-dependent dehydrogenase (short-subunit alcohol dehydrogenase family)